MWSPMSPRRLCDGSDIMSNSGRQRYRWHSGSNSMSCPSTMSVHSVPLDHDISFRSDISVYSTTSAQEQKSSWFCGGCSYRNSDMLHTTCALCGCRRGGICAFPVPVASCASTSRVSRPLRPRSEDDQEVVQPAQPPIGFFSTASASESQGGKEDHDDLSSIASKVTCRRGSLSKTNLIATTKLGAATSTYSSGNESGSDCSSDSSRRRAMPHDDPIEQPSYVPRRSRRGPGPEIAAPHCHQPDLTRSVQGARNPSPLPANNTMTILTEQQGRKKKSIKDYIPRLRRRQSRAHARATPSPPAGDVPASSKRERPSSTGHLPTGLLDQKLDFVTKNGPDSPSSFSSHHCSEEFMIACGAQSGRDLPRGGFGAVAVPGLYDY